ncbi:MAG: CopG family transcriptional regulator [Ignisphaera sp.]|uniref:CopG family transcriptional regulator n=1 Tax=Ignisphaera aggregans TaxID=334771 RepID=A0A7J3MYJ1_9CREN
MSKSRRCIGIDTELAEELKNISKARGMSIVNYLRKLLEELIDLEKQGYYVPDLLHEKKIELVLSKLGFVYVPSEVVSETLKPEDVETIGEKIGKALIELDLDIEEIIERIAIKNDIAIVQRNSIILIPTVGVKEMIKYILIGIAKAAGIPVSTSGSTVMIRSKRY